MCNNWFSEVDLKEKSKTLPEIVTTSAVLDIEKQKITKVTYVKKAFIDGEITETWKFNLVCNVPDVENDKLECLEDNMSFISESSELHDYSYLKITGGRDQTEASLLSKLRDGKLLTYSFGDLRIYKTNKGTELDASEDEIQLLRCK